MESISRISSILETARDLTLEAARDASALRKPASHPTPIPQLKKLLDSRSDRDVLEGLRRVISLSYHTPQTNQSPLLFSSVLKNIASPSLPIKKLVYIYLLQHAESEPDTALLAINTIQKTLSAPDPQLRALALRTMSGIRVPVISQIVSLAIKRGCADMSPLVRKAAALAIVKCWRLDPGTAPQLLEYLDQLLGDKQYFVVGAAVSAFMEVCPERIDLIHKHYRSLVRKVVDMDEWGQLATLKLMISYARRCFPQRTKRIRRDEISGKTKDFYQDENTGDTNTADEQEDEVPIIEPDLELLLKSTLPLLQSRNSAVVIAVARLYLYLTPPSPISTYLSSAIGPLISLLRSPQEIQQIALYNIVQVALIHPHPFTRYATHFLIRSTDPPPIWRLKLEALTIMFPHIPPHLQSLILTELSHFSSSTSPALTRESVRAIGRCAQTSPPGSPTASRCLRLLLHQLASTNGDLVAESLTVIRHLIQADPAAHAQTVIRLAKTLDTMTSPRARATIIWLVGESASAEQSNNIAPDVLRVLAKGFADEAEETKLQIVLLAAKVYLHYLNSVQQQGEQQQTKPTQLQDTSRTAGYEMLNNPEDTDGFQDHNVSFAPEHQPPPPHPIPLLWTYILLLTRYDTSYDLRDRARVFKTLLAIPTSTQLASLLLLAPKPVPQTPSPSESRRNFMLGSVSLVVGSRVASHGHDELPEWVQPGKEPDPELREEGAAGKETYGDKVLSASERLDAQAGTSALPSGKRVGLTTVTEKSLDDWLAEDEDGGEESEKEEDDEEEEEGETESEESTEAESSEASSEESDDEDDEHVKLMK